MHPKNEYQWEVLNLGEISVHAVFIIWAQHSWPPTLSSINMDMRCDLLTKVGE